MPIIDIKVPAAGESVTEATLAAWLVEDGDYVEMDQEICELETDKATMELPAEKAGIIKILIPADEDVEVGTVICTIDTDAAGAAPSKEAPKAEEKAPETPKPAEKPAPSTQNYATGHPSPAAKKILDENNISSGDVKGTGKDGRITKEDAQKAADGKKSVPKPEKTTPKPQTSTASSGERGVRKEKMSRLRRTIAKHLVNAKNSTAMLTTFNEVDLTEVMAVRKKYKEMFKEKHQIGLGFMSFFTKACAMALQEYQAVNAQIDGDHVVYHDFVDVSVAVSTPKGLVTPVIRNAETLTLKEIEQTVKDLAIRGRDNELTLDDMQGGTFTISNGGVFGSLVSTPIINAPQTAILGMHKIQQRPMVVNGEVVARPMMYLALSYDHRIIDGKEAVTFLVRVKDLLEDPIRLMLDV